MTTYHQHFFQGHPAFTSPYPHVGGCEVCHGQGVCNYCGADVQKDPGRCTNGRCSHCHARICTPGESHGYGRPR